VAFSDARIGANGRAMRGGCARRIVASTARAIRPVLGEFVRNGLSMEHRAFGGAPEDDGQCAGRSRVAVALSAAVGCDRLTVPVLRASCRGPKVGGARSAPRGAAWRGGDRSPREMIRNYACRVCVSSLRSVELVRSGWIRVPRRTASGRISPSGSTGGGVTTLALTAFGTPPTRVRRR
jgi:hypothetical protein